MEQSQQITKDEASHFVSRRLIYVLWWMPLVGLALLAFPGRNVVMALVGLGAGLVAGSLAGKGNVRFVAGLTVASRQRPSLRWTGFTIGLITAPALAIPYAILYAGLFFGGFAVCVGLVCVVWRIAPWLGPPWARFPFVSAETSDPSTIPAFFLFGVFGTVFMWMNFYRLWRWYASLPDR